MQRTRKKATQAWGVHTNFTQTVSWPQDWIKALELWGRNHYRLCHHASFNKYRVTKNNVRWSKTKPYHLCLKNQHASLESQRVLWKTWRLLKWKLCHLSRTWNSKTKDWLLPRPKNIGIKELPNKIFIQAALTTFYFHYLLILFYTPRCKFLCLST